MTMRRPRNPERFAMRPDTLTTNGSLPRDLAPARREEHFLCYPTPGTEPLTTQRHALTFELTRHIKRIKRYCIRVRFVGSEWCPFVRFSEMRRRGLLSRPFAAADIGRRHGLLLMSVQLFAGLEAESQTRIPSDLACPRCSIRVEALTTVGRHDETLNSRPYVVRRDSRGQFLLVTPETRPSMPLVFSPQGRFVRAIGREGAGPNEFKHAVALDITASETLYVFDRSNARMTVLDPRLREVRTAPIPPSTNTAILLASGAVVLNAAVWDQQRIGHPFHLFDAVGNYRGFFGADPDESVRPGDVSSAVRWLTPAHGNQFWSMHHTRSYTLELWDAHGTLKKRFTRTADWFGEYDRATNLAPGSPPQSRGMGVWFDSRDGLLWTIVHVADPRWREGVGPLMRAEGQEYYPIRDRQRVYDAIVEVIDVGAGRVIARQRFERTVDIPVGGGVFAGVRETAAGVPYLELWRFSLITP
jgi:hypothetical protein